MTATIELNSARRKLQNALGDDHKIYFSQLRSWFRKRCTKEEFDVEAKKLLSADNAHLHNEFLLAILNKCQTLANFTIMTSPPIKTPVSLPGVLSPTTSIGSPNSSFTLNRTSTMESSPSENGTRLKLGPVKRKHKSNRPTFDQRFVPSSPPAEALLPNCDELETYDPDERNLMFAQREPTLPDMAFVGGRLLIAAWDEGLDGSVNDPAASRLIVTAVHQLLKRIVLSLLADKSAFKTKNNSKEPYAVGISIPNPYLISRQQPQRWLEPDKVANHLDEQSAIWELACAHRDAIYPATHPNTVTLFDLMDTLKKDRTLIPSHAVYSLNMERLISRLHHED
eukprot:05681.XXX_218602_219618_1 [CDS] Oithona nana genome sequencing.